MTLRRRHRFVYMSVPEIQPTPPPLPLPPIWRLRWAIHLLIIAALPVIAGISGLSRFTGDQPALTHHASGLLIVCAWSLAFFAVPSAIAWLISRPTVDELYLRWRPGFWVAPLGLVYSVAIRFGAGLILIGFYAILVATRVVSVQQMQELTSAQPAKLQSILDVHALKHDPAYFWLNLTLVSFVVGGLREEIWRASFLAGMRSLWPRWFSSQGGQIAAAGVGAVLFGIGHLPQGTPAACLIGLVGFGLGVIMVCHRSIWPAVLAHGIFDATSIALIPWVTELVNQARQTTGA